ncbi:Aste57867_16331 [Aphanomyces stellatus]|uniref:Aste57867_16331 protein n=1 Tax=Aphanomyces stellatus TaxID=120398 RepID=A0A485L661_9STRA|nr:hypothetical protein As57867_016274 [Aphanomyces stellatus]VFT93107.1 Aste57867_16331 [Aphanomyces stellatus]
MDSRRRPSSSSPPSSLSVPLELPPSSQASSLTVPLLEDHGPLSAPLKTRPPPPQPPLSRVRLPPTRHWCILLGSTSSHLSYFDHGVDGVVVILAGGAVGVLLGTGVFDKTSSDADFESIPARSAACSIVMPAQRVVEVWPTQTRGCSSTAFGVTHVVLPFVEVSAKLTLDVQTNLAKCIPLMRAKCVYVLGALQGPLTDISNANTPTDAARLLTRYRLDGLSIQDFKSSKEKLQSAVPAIASAVKASMPAAILTMDVDVSNSDGFPSGVDQSLDWVNVRAYNVDSDTDKSNDLYANATTPSGVFDTWKARLTSPAKMNIGVCVDCSPRPPLGAVAAWATYGQQSAGGMTIDGSVTQLDLWATITQTVVASTNTSGLVIPTTLAPPVPTRAINASTVAPPTTNQTKAATKCGTTRPRLVEFWGSEVAGCETVPDGVTHIIFSFALVQGGVVVPTFQGSDASIAACVAKLHTKCVFVLASIGGDTNRDQMAAIADPVAFATSALALVQKFNFDGVDIDDESRGAAFSPARVLAYMQGLSSVFRPKKLLVSFDSYMYEADPAQCAATRCFPRGVEAYVDWINVMAYNVNLDPTAANAMYVAATQPSNIFSLWAALATPTKVVLGVCTTTADPLTSGCAYGPGPSNAVIAQWAAWSKAAGGMMVWTASKDAPMGYPLTNYILTQTGSAPKS